MVPSSAFGTIHHHMGRLKGSANPRADLFFAEITVWNETFSKNFKGTKKGATACLL